MARTSDDDDRTGVGTGLTAEFKIGDPVVVDSEPGYVGDVVLIEGVHPRTKLWLSIHPGATGPGDWMTYRDAGGGVTTAPLCVFPVSECRHAAGPGPDPTFADLVEYARASIPEGTWIKVSITRDEVAVFFGDGDREGDTSLTRGGIVAEFLDAIEACKELGEEAEGDDDDD